MLPVKSYRLLVAGLRFKNDHPRAGSHSHLGHLLHEKRSDSAATTFHVKYADIAEPEAIVPLFKKPFGVSCKQIALKRAVGDRLIKPLAEEFIVKRFSTGSPNGR